MNKTCIINLTLVASKIFLYKINNIKHNQYKVEKIYEYNEMNIKFVFLNKNLWFLIVIYYILAFQKKIDKLWNELRIFMIDLYINEFIINFN